MSHLTREQRYAIGIMLEQGKNQKQIAETLKKDKSIISRKLARNCDRRSGNYNYDLAHRKYLQRLKQKPKAIKFTEAVREYVDSKLQDKWSPE